MPDAFEHVAFLSRSRTRVCLLVKLCEEGPTSRRDLRDELETSQSTVVRSVQALERRDWVENDDGVVRVTGAGKLIADAFRDLVEVVDETTDLGPFLRWFPHDEFDLNLAHLRGATVTTSTPGDPYAPARTQTELVRSANSLRVFLPSIDLEGTEVVHERTLGGDLAGEVVVGPNVCEMIRGGDYAPFFREMLGTGRMSVAAVDKSVPFYLGLDGGDAVQIGVEDDAGMPKALLETDGDPVRSWAEDVYASYSDRATELTATDFR